VFVAPEQHQVLVNLSAFFELELELEFEVEVFKTFLKRINSIKT
jgi:hypothetical protein